MCAGVHGKNAWERSEKQAQGSTVIFEGILEHSELQWKAGDGSANPLDSSQMRLTFHVQRAYKGDVGREVLLSTGLGGGDCGARFSRSHLLGLREELGSWWLVGQHVQSGGMD